MVTIEDSEALMFLQLLERTPLPLIQTMPVYQSVRAKYEAAQMIPLGAEPIDAQFSG